MGKLDLSKLSSYNQPKEKTNFFSLKENGDTAKIRFCYNSADEVEIRTIHTVECNDGKKRKVECLREFGESRDKCPLCQEGNHPVQVRFFIWVLQYNEDGTVTKKLWERGKQFQNELESLNKRYQPLCKQVFEVERQGNKGDQTTRYGLFPIMSEQGEYPIHQSELENKSVVGITVLNKTADEMERYLSTGDFLDKKKENVENKETANSDNLEPVEDVDPDTLPF